MTSISPSIVWSPMQQALRQFIISQETSLPRGPRKSLLVNALAGSGKSTTTLELMSLAEKFQCDVAYSTYNSAPLKEFLQKATIRGLRCAQKRGCSIRTAHGFGNAALWRVRQTKDEPDGRKVSKILWDLYGSDRTKKDLIPMAAQLVDHAKNRGFGVEGMPDIEDSSAWQNIIDHHELDTEGNDTVIVTMGIEALQRSNATLTSIDFSDMIYLPLLMNLPFTKYDYVFLDEAQDTNPTRRELFLRLLKPWGSIVIVGDRHQAIYGFTGADHNSLDQFVDKVSPKVLPLSICYRCDRAIIREAQRLVPEIQCRPDADEGQVLKVQYKDFIKNDLASLTGHDAILCRNNASNVKLAFTMIRLGHPCRIEGRDIGKSLIDLVDKLGATDLHSFSDRLHEWYSLEMSKNRDKLEVQSNIDDRFQTLNVILDRAFELKLSISGLRELIYSMFTNADDPSTPRHIPVLSSIHKAKGREWQRVFILGRSQFMPSPFATAPWQREQERNLEYVAITRAEHTLVDITNVS